MTNQVNVCHLLICQNDHLLMLLIVIINSATSSGGFLTFFCDIKWWVSATSSGGFSATPSGGFSATHNLTLSHFEDKIEKAFCWRG